VSGQIRLGTRGSALALAQAGIVAEALGGAEVVPIATGGDRGAGAEDKSRWVDALEEALLAGEVDLAVHSAKDVPGELAGGLALVAALKRGEPRDTLCGARSLDELRPGARVGTSSLRRRAALLAARPDLEVVAVRGNVDTRLRKLAAGEADALVLAKAGLDRLGRGQEAGAVLPVAVMVPAPGQGTLALETRTDDGQAREAAAQVADEAAMRQLRAERALVERLGATCHTPVGAHATSEDAHLRVHAFAGLPDGSEWARDELAGPLDDPEGLGRACAERLLGAGAEGILRRAEEVAA
jgi:hydroxymethylbilane synthase